MLCQNCKINESTIHLYTNVNGHKQQVDLCQNCYQIMKTDPEHSLFGGIANANNHGTDPIDDFFNSLRNQLLLLPNLAEPMEAVAATVPILARVVSLSQVRKSQKVCWKSLVSTSQSWLAAARLILLLAVMKKSSVSLKFSTAAPKTILFS